MSKAAATWRRIKTEKSYLEISEWEWANFILRLTHNEKYSKIRASIYNSEIFNKVFKRSHRRSINRMKIGKKVARKLASQSRGLEKKGVYQENITIIFSEIPTIAYNNHKTPWNLKAFWICFTLRIWKQYPREDSVLKGKEPKKKHCIRSKV